MKHSHTKPPAEQEEDAKTHKTMVRLARLLAKLPKKEEGKLNTSSVSASGGKLD